MCNKDPLLDVSNHDEKSDPKERFLQNFEEYGIEIDDEIRLDAERLFSEWFDRISNPFLFYSNVDLGLTCNSVFDLLDYRKISPNIGFSPFEISASIARKYFPTSPFTLFETGLGEALMLERHFNFFVLALYGEDFFFSQALFDDEALGLLNSTKGPTRSAVLWTFFDLLLDKNGYANISFYIDHPSSDIKLESAISAASLNLLSGPPTKSTHGLLQGIEFLKAWIRYDAESNRITSHRLEMFSGIHFLWDKLGKDLEKAEQDLSPTLFSIVGSWLDETKKELCFFYRYTDLATLSGKQTKVWTLELDLFYWGYFERDDNDSVSNTEHLAQNEKIAQKNDTLNQFFAQLTPRHIEMWIKNNSHDSAVSFLPYYQDNKMNHDLYALLDFFGEKSWGTDHFNTWKKGFEEGLSSLGIGSRLNTLTKYLKLLKQADELAQYHSKHSETSDGDKALIRLGQIFTERDKDWQTSYWDWCYSLIISLHKDKDFPESLMPEWTLVLIPEPTYLEKHRLSPELSLLAIEKSLEVIFSEFREGVEPSRIDQLEKLLKRLEPTKILEYTNKCIGLLRGKISKRPVSEKLVKSKSWPNIWGDPDQLLSRRLRKLDAMEPVQALRHRLLLMRSSQAPFSDESVYRDNSSAMHISSDICWHSSLIALAHRFANDWDDPKKREAWLNRYQYKHSEDQLLSHGEEEEWKHLMAFSQELAEFCLNRLRLRKGQKPSEGQYHEDQVTEKSPIWRKGYLRALAELGFDLGGKVHKTVYFTKQYDPDESVRAAAKECYRAVRRDTKKQRSIKDLKRGIIAAEWWLLICQRKALGLDVSTEGARKTRRNLLRNP